MHICMAGFRRGITLSDNGCVTRGVCHIEDGKLVGVTVTHNIFKTADGAETRNDDGTAEALDTKSLVSMNMWGLTPEFVETLEKGFKEFFEKPDVDVLKGEYLLPIYIDELLQKGEVTVKVLETQDKWFGVTYKEDKDSVVESFKKLIEEGVYKEKLFDDIL